MDSPDDTRKPTSSEVAAVLRADRIERLVDAAPPLTPEQREKLAALISGQ